jgi:hypothetical protein
MSVPSKQACTGLAMTNADIRGRMIWQSVVELALVNTETYFFRRPE